jgi:hypothetical protein
LERTYPDHSLQTGCAFPRQQVSLKRRLLHTIVEGDADKIMQQTALSLATCRGQTRCKAHSFSGRNMLTIHSLGRPYLSSRYLIRHPPSSLILLPLRGSTSFATTKMFSGLLPSRDTNSSFIMGVIPEDRITIGTFCSFAQ